LNAALKFEPIRNEDVTLEEKAYLLRSRGNTSRLIEAIHVLETDDYTFWQATDPKMVSRVNQLRFPRALGCILTMRLLSISSTSIRHRCLSLST